MHKSYPDNSKAKVKGKVFNEFPSVSNHGLIEKQNTLMKIFFQHQTKG